jgi:hypothetical protein
MAEGARASQPGDLIVERLGGELLVYDTERNEAHALAGAGAAEFLAASGDVSRREVLRKLALAGVAAAGTGPLVKSIVAPIPANAQSAPCGALNQPCCSFLGSTYCTDADTGCAAGLCSPLIECYPATVTELAGVCSADKTCCNGLLGNSGAHLKACCSFGETCCHTQIGLDLFPECCSATQTCVDGVGCAG